MSFYNLIHGENPQAQILLAILGLTRADVPRYRDCYWTGSEIAIYTRTGGGNREAYKSQNQTLCALPTFIRDEDDDFDSTYAIFYFNPPEVFADVLKELHAVDATPAQRWESFLDRLKAGDKNDPQVTRVIEAMEPTLEQIKERLEKP